MTTPKNNKGSSPKKTVILPKTIDIHYLKTNNYRTYHIDGIFGGLTGYNKLYIELFIERGATPQITQHEITPEGMIGKEINRAGKKGIIREIEAGLIMDISTAKIIRDWLDEKIIELGHEPQEIIEEQKGQKNE